MGGQNNSNDVRALIADAVSTLDRERVADALLEAVQRLLSPLVFAGFVLEPGKPVELRRFVVDPRWDGDHAFDFGWLEPVLGLGLADGTSVIGPDLQGASQIATVLNIGNGRVTYLVVVGEYEDPESARELLAGVAVSAGLATETVRKANERAADTVALRERERLSRDLHDSLSQSLWSLSMLSESAHSMIDPGDPLYGIIQKITEISLSSQEEMRGLLINLRSAESSRETIAGVLEALVADFRASHDVEIIASIAEADLDAKAVMSFRRIAEEALNNVGRHADASTVAVLFDADPVLTLRVADDGVGFDAKPVKGHLGLRIMEERAEEAGCRFELASVAGAGTVVTASVDPSQARPMPMRRERPGPPSIRQAALYLLMGTVGLALAIGVLFVSRSDRSEAEHVQAELDVLAVLEQRVEIGRATANEAAARLLNGVGQIDVDGVIRATAAREKVIAEARNAMEPLASPGSSSSEDARQLLDVISGLSVFGPPDDRLSRLYDDVYLVESSNPWPTLETAAPAHSLRSLATLDHAVTYSLLDSVAARYAMSPDSYNPSDPLGDYYDEVAEEVREFGGYFGPDSSVPLLNGLIPTGIALVHEREAVAELNQILADAGLWEDDQWLRGWSVDADPPPVSLEQYVERSTQASVAGRELIDARFAAERAELSALRASDHRTAQRFLLVARLLALVAALALFRSAALFLRRKRATALDEGIDPLTGVGNRKALTTEVGRLLDDPQLGHHILITLDMDRMALINDAHGRGFGDRMLEVIGAGLGAMSYRVSEFQSAAVRLEGDKFLVSFHSEVEISVAVAHRAMDRLRSTVISAGDGTLVRCSFSYGLVSAEGNPDLGSLMASCDLALYEDKSRMKSSPSDIS